MTAKELEKIKKRVWSKIINARKAVKKMGSPRFSLNTIDLKSIGKGLLIAVTGAALTYVNGVVMQTDFTVHYNDLAVNLTPIVVAGWSGVVNLVRKWIADNSA